MSNFKCQISNKISNSKLEIRNWKLEILCKAEQGFTIIELLLAIGIVSILFGLTTFNLLKTQNSTSVATAKETLIADLKSQQLKAMNGTDGAGSFGIHFPGNSTYTLFKGINYVNGAPSNADVTIDGGINFSCPSCTNNDIVFTQITGEAAPSSFIVAHAAGNDSRTIVINKYGVVTSD